MVTTGRRPATHAQADDAVANAGVQQGSATTLQSVRRAARLLVAVARDNGLTARQAADRFSLSLPTSYHLLNSLAVEGLLSKEAHGVYALGPLADVIAQAVDRDMRPKPQYLVALRTLVDMTGETAYLSCWHDGEVRIISVIESTQMVRATGLAVGYSQNLHARTSARVLFAFADAQFRMDQIDRLRLRRLTPTTITTRRDFERDLDRIKDTGVAIGRDEYVSGLTCASAPIIEGGVVNTAITIAVPSDRFRTTEPTLIEALKSAAVRAAQPADSYPYA